MLDLIKQEIDRSLLRYAVQRHVQCPICADILDCETNCVLVFMNEKTSCACVKCFKDIASRKKFHPAVEIHSTEDLEISYFDPNQTELYFGQK